MINLKKLLKEDIQKESLKERPADLVRKGLEKVFESSDGDIPYRRLENVGLGYIKSVSEAIKVAVQESRKLAEKYGYSDNEIREVFVKTQVKEEEKHSETDMSNPEENKEVQLARQILKVIEDYLQHDLHPYHEEGVQKIKALATQFLQMHGQSEKKPYDGPPIFTGGGHGGL